MQECKFSLINKRVASYQHNSPLKWKTDERRSELDDDGYRRSAAACLPGRLLCAVEECGVHGQTDPSQP